MNGFEQFEGNPFEGILSALQGNNAQQQGMGSSMMPQQGMTQQKDGMMGGMMEGIEMEDNQLMKGKNPDNSQNLVGAVRALQSFIANSTNPTEIATARSIISLLSRLMDQDQKKMTDSLGQDQEMMQAAQPPQSA